MEEDHDAGSETDWTMKLDFYRRRLMKRHGIKTVIPSDDEVSMIHRVINPSRDLVTAA